MSDSHASSCPLCRKPTVAASRPFCSEHCRLTDLHRWMVGAYAVPTEEAPDDAALSADVEKA